MSSEYQHNYAKLDLGGGRNRGYFKFTLENDINCDESIFGVSVNQQGDRLHCYRLAADQGGFKCSQFNIILMKDSKIVKAACLEFTQFFNCLVID